MTDKLYLIAIGKSFSPEYRIAGYTRTKTAAKAILREMGYPNLHKVWGYYHNKKDTFSGKWAQIIEVKEL